MKSFNFYITAILVFLVSCSEEKVSKNTDYLIVSVNTQSDTIITDNPVFTKMRYVKLETKEDCLLENVTKVVPFEDRLYILSSLGQGNVFIFDDKGKYVKQINKGNGPEDIVYPTDITIDSTKKELLILDYYRHIKRYDLNGNFIQKISMEEPFLALETIGENFLLFDSNTRSKADYHLRYMIGKSKSKDLFLKPLKGKLFYSSNFFTKAGNGKVLVSCILSDTIFYITDTQRELFPYIVLDFHDKNANKKERLDKINDLGEYLRNAREQNYITGPSELSMLNDNLFFTLNGKEYYYARYETKRKMISLHKNLVEGLPNIYTSVGRTDKEVVYAMDIPWLMEYFKENPGINTGVINQLKDECNDGNDNPVLLFCSF